MTIDWPSLAEIVKIIVTALPPTLVALAAYRSSRQVHQIVNSQRTEMVAKIDAGNEKRSIDTAEILTLRQELAALRSDLDRMRASKQGP